MSEPGKCHGSETPFEFRLTDGQLFGIMRVRNFNTKPVEVTMFARGEGDWFLAFTFTVPAAPAKLHDADPAPCATLEYTYGDPILGPGDFRFEASDPVMIAFFVNECPLTEKRHADLIEDLRWEIADGPDGCASEKQESCELGDPRCVCLKKARARFTARKIQ